MKRAIDEHVTEMGKNMFS